MLCFTDIEASLMAPEPPRTHLSKILYKKIILRYSVDNFSPMPLPSHG